MYLYESGKPCRELAGVSIAVIETYYVSNVAMSYFFAFSCHFSYSSSSKVIISMFSLEKPDIIVGDSSIEDLNSDFFISNFWELGLESLEAIVVNDKPGDFLGHDIIMQWVDIS